MNGASVSTAYPAALPASLAGGSWKDIREFVLPIHGLLVLKNNGELVLRR